MPLPSCSQVSASFTARQPKILASQLRSKGSAVVSPDTSRSPSAASSWSLGRASRPVILCCSPSRTRASPGPWSATLTFCLLYPPAALRHQLELDKQPCPGPCSGFRALFSVFTHRTDKCAKSHTSDGPVSSLVTARALSDPAAACCGYQPLPL